MYKIVILIFLFSISCSNEEVETTVKSKKTIPVGPQFSSKILFKEGKGWGYQIFKGATLLINQEHIPAVQGLQYFSTKEKAEITAKYILTEVEKGNFPPTVDQNILDSLGVLD